MVGVGVPLGRSVGDGSSVGVVGEGVVVGVGVSDGVPDGVSDGSCDGDSLGVSKWLCCGLSGLLVPAPLEPVTPPRVEPWSDALPPVYDDTLRPVRASKPVIAISTTANVAAAAR